MARIGCVFIARFELAFRLRGAPERWAAPLAVADLASPRATLLELTPAAEALGLSVGLRLPEALARAPGLELVAPDGPGRQAAEQELLGALSAVAPALDADGRGAFFLSLAGLEQLHPTEEHALARAQDALERLGYAASAAAADGTLAARVAAGRWSGVTVVPPGGDGAVLAGVPVAALGLSPPIVEWLRLLGLQEVGALAALPPGTLSARLPGEGARLERLCRGELEVARPTEARAPRAAEEVTLELEGPTSALEPLVFLFKSLVDRLLGRLRPRGRALAELVVEVRLDDRTTATHRLRPARATLEARPLVELGRLWLSGQPFAAPVAALRLVAGRLEEASAHQLGLFRRREEQAEHALATAVQRLTAAFGEAAVVRPVLVDTHRPEARLQWRPYLDPEPPRTSQPPGTTGESGAQAGPLFATGGPAGRGTPSALPASLPPVTLLRSSPLPLVRRARQLRASDGTTLEIARVEGPHRVTGDWWGPAPFDRSYFWVEGTRGERWWIFGDERDGGRLYLHAVAD